MTDTKAGVPAESRPTPEQLAKTLFYQEDGDILRSDARVIAYGAKVAEAYAASSSLLPVRQQIDIQELRLEGKGTDHIWLMEDGAEPHTIGIRLDSGDSGVVYVTPNQAKDLAEQLTAITSVASLPVGESTPLGRQKFAVVRYTNYKGQTANRSIVPVRIYLGSTEQHPEEQWLLEAFDLGRNAARTFAMKDMQWNPELPVGRQPYKLIQLCELHHLGHLDCPNCQFIEPIDDAVIAETHVVVPRDLKCHKCGSSEPWKDAERPEVNQAVERALTTTAEPAGRQLEPTPEFVKLAMGLAKTGEMLKGPARNIMEQIKSGMDVASLPVGESRQQIDKAFEGMSTDEAYQKEMLRIAGERPSSLVLVLAAHWLTEIHCDHEAKTDEALCYCGWRSPAYPSVGRAVEHWARHVSLNFKLGLGESREPLPEPKP